MDEEYLIATIENAAYFSEDPSTQLCASIITNDFEYVWEVNKLLRNIVDKSKWHKDTKYKYVQHAERAVILNAARLGITLEDATMYCNWYACLECAKAIIESGIKRVVGLKTDLYDNSTTWGESVKEGIRLLKEAGVQCEWIELPKLNIDIRIRGITYTL